MMPARSTPAERAIDTKSSVSSSVEIIGAMTHGSALVSRLAFAIAVSWFSSTERFSHEVR